MSGGDRHDVRGEMLRLLMGKVAEDSHPSNTMLDMIEGMLRPDEVPAYVELLMQKIRGDRFPSIPLMNRLAKYS